MQCVFQGSSTGFWRGGRLPLTAPKSPLAWSLFRPNQVSVLDSYHYDDGCEPCGNDTFSREPVVVKFFSPYTGECRCASHPSPSQLKSRPLEACDRAAPHPPAPSALNLHSITRMVLSCGRLPHVFISVQAKATPT